MKKEKIPIDPLQLGHTFERSMTHSKRKLEGIYYTPSSITKYICNQVMYRWIMEKYYSSSNNYSEHTFREFLRSKTQTQLREIKEKIERLQIIDPACGAGAFLYQILHDLKTIHYILNMEIIDSEHSNFEQKIVEKNLFGFDLDEQSIEITKQILAQENEIHANNIICQNSLVDDHTIAGNKALNLKNTQKFDIILGNPPYINARNMKKTYLKEREYIRKTYHFLQERWDIYLAFIEQALNLLAPRGFIGFLIPDAFLTEKYAAKMREILLEKYRIVQLDFFPEIFLFSGINVRNIILIIQNVPPSFPVRKIKHENWNLPNYYQIIEEISDKSNIFTPIQSEITKFNSDNFTLLGDICYISKGMVLNADERKFQGEFTKKDLIADQLDAVHCKEILQGEDIAEFYITGKKFLEWNTERIPKKISRMTFLELYNPPRLVTNKLGKLKVAYFTQTNCICDQTVRILMKWKDLPNHSIRSLQSSIKKFSAKNLDQLKQISENFEYKYLLAVLNSSPCGKIFNTLRNKSKDINPDVLRKIPIPKIKLQQQMEIIKIVEQILADPSRLELKHGLDLKIESFFKGT